MSKFDYSLDYANLNFRDRPDLYRIGKGEQGVLLVQPYKAEILPYWRFKTPEIALESSNKIYQLFLAYLAEEDFVGADMARKFLQMGYTRSRRYANHKSGKKYRLNPQLQESQAAEKAARKEILPLELDPVKAKSAEIFKHKWHEAKANHKYQQLSRLHKAKYPDNNGQKAN
jgi:mannitol-1-phosphate/altronate dehydrogenase